MSWAYLVLAGFLKLFSPLPKNFRIIFESLAFYIIFSFKYFDILFFDESYSYHSSWKQLCGVDRNWCFRLSSSRYCLFYGASYGLTYFIPSDAYFFDNW